MWMRVCVCVCVFILINSRKKILLARTNIRHECVMRLLKNVTVLEFIPMLYEQKLL